MLNFSAKLPANHGALNILVEIGFEVFHHVVDVGGGRGVRCVGDDLSTRNFLPYRTDL